MSFTQPLLAPHIAGIAAGLRATAETRGNPLRAWHVLILALLARLFPRRLPPTPLLTALDLPTPENRPAYCYNVYGRAPHAAVVALGLVPDWILVGAPGRGMRPARHTPLHRRPTQPARAPPTKFSAPPTADAPARPYCSVIVITPPSCPQPPHPIGRNPLPERPAA